MVEPRSRASGNRRRYRWFALIGILVVAAARGGLGVSLSALRCGLRSGKTFSERRRAGGGRKSTPGSPGGFVVHPEDDKARMMLAKVRLRQQRRDAVAEVLKPIPEIEPGLDGSAIDSR